MSSNLLTCNPVKVSTKRFGASKTRATFSSPIDTKARLRYETGVQAVVTMYLWPRKLVPPLITGFTVDASRLIKAIKAGQ
jgi:hypothetical protein